MPRLDPDWWRPALLRSEQPVGCEHPRRAEITALGDVHRRIRCVDCPAEWWEEFR